MLIKSGIAFGFFKCGDNLYSLQKVGNSAKKTGNFNIIDGLFTMIDHLSAL